MSGQVMGDPHPSRIASCMYCFRQAVQKTHWHSWSVVILSRDCSHRQSLQVRRGARARSPGSGFSAVMVRQWRSPAEPTSLLGSPQSRLRLCEVQRVSLSASCDRKGDFCALPHCFPALQRHLFLKVNRCLRLQNELSSAWSHKARSRGLAASLPPPRAPSRRSSVRRP